MSDDYGYFGKGINGYVHYMQAFEQSGKGGGGRKPHSGCGCLTSVLTGLAALLLLVFLILA